MWNYKRDGRVWRWITGLLLALLLLGGCGTISASKVAVMRPTATPRPLPSAAQLDAYLSHLTATGAFRGSVLVGDNGMLFSKGYGLADKDKHILNTPQTAFRIGSITKQFTAMAILILQERGKLHVQDHICIYIASCPSGWQLITIYQLLTHTSGIPDYTSFANFVATMGQPVTPEQLLNRFKNKPRDFLPGTKFRYSNSNYIVLGYIIEKASGESYALFLRENIFAPLQMRNTGYDENTPQLPKHATGYYENYVKTDFIDMSVPFAAGALYSTVLDMYMWDQALLTHRLVSQQSLDAMFTPHTSCYQADCLTPGDLGYGYGWYIAQDVNGKLIYHPGAIDGYISYNGFYPGRNVYIVVLSNLGTTDVLKIGSTLASMILKGDRKKSATTLSNDCTVTMKHNSSRNITDRYSVI